MRFILFVLNLVVYRGTVHGCFSNILTCDEACGKKINKRYNFVVIPILDKVEHTPCLKIKNCRWSNKLNIPPPYI